MPNDEKVKEDLRNAFLENMKKILESDKAENTTLALMSISVDFQEKENKQDVVICEDENGGSTVVRVHEQDGEDYCILDLDDDWASPEWWETNSFVLPEDVALAVAYDYLQQTEPELQSVFASRDYVKSLLCLKLKSLDKQDDFAKDLLALLVDFDGHSAL